MNKRMTPEARELATAIRANITAARKANEAAIIHYQSFAKPCPSAPRGVMYDLTVPEAMAANQALGTTSKAVEIAEAQVTRKCPVEERQDCARCCGDGRLWQFGHVMGGVCFSCGGRKWRPRDRWVRACMPDPNA